MRRKADLLPALHDPLFVRDGLVHDRTVVFSRLIWRYWGGPQVVIPDLAITKSNFEAARPARHRRLQEILPHFTLYAVMIRKFGDRPRYEMSAIPATGDDHVCGIEFSPLLEGVQLLARSLPAVQERDLRYRPRSRRQLLPLRRRA